MKYWLVQVRKWVYAHGYRPTPNNFLLYSPTLEINEDWKDLAHVQFFERLNHDPIGIVEDEPPYKARHRELLKKEEI